MLVLSRKHRQWLTITHKGGDTVRVIVADIQRDAVKLAFEDPERHFQIDREEREPRPPATIAIRPD